MERAFGTPQQRLPPELRVAGVAGAAAANAYPRAVFVPACDARFGKAAAEPGTAFVAYAGAALADVLCAQAERRVGRDNCVARDGRSLQIPPQLHRRHYVRVTVRVHEHPDGGLAAFDGPRCLARYDSGGGLLANADRRAA